MDLLRLTVVALFVIGATACAEVNTQLGASGAIQDRVFPADSKKMALFRAELAMMFLSFVAVDGAGRTGAENIAVVASLNRTALDIDCLRASASGSTFSAPSLPPPKGVGPRTELCPKVDGLYFFDTRMVSVERDLLALAKASLPNASLAALLAAIPNSTTQPLALVGPILAVARDAVAISQRGFALYRDGIEIEVEVYCSAQGIGPDDMAACRSLANDIDNGRDVEKQRQFVLKTVVRADSRLTMAPSARVFDAARALTAINCGRLRDLSGSVADTIKCRLPTDWSKARD